jgi:hypothetical protein
MTSGIKKEHINENSDSYFYIITITYTHKIRQKTHRFQQNKKALDQQV